MHRIFQVDVFRFLNTFHNQVCIQPAYSLIFSCRPFVLDQLTNAHLPSFLPQRMHHLSWDKYLTYTYAAITIERVLFIKHGAQLA